MMKALPLVSSQLGTDSQAGLPWFFPPAAVLSLRCGHISLAFMHQAASVQGHSSPPGRGNILPLFPELLQLVSYSKALAGKWFSVSGSSCTSPGQRPRLRPLYQYINFDMPELMDPSAEEDEVPGLAEPSQVPAAPGRATAPHLEGELQGLPSSSMPSQGPGLVLPVTCWSL